MKDFQPIVLKDSLSSKKKKEPIPNPGQEVAIFIAWLKKRGYCQKLVKCEKKCDHLGLDFEDDILTPLGNEIIRVFNSRGEKVVVLLDKTWAQDISTYHGVDIPHHRHHQPM